MEIFNRVGRFLESINDPVQDSTSQNPTSTPNTENSAGAPTLRTIEQKSQTASKFVFNQFVGKKEHKVFRDIENIFPPHFLDAIKKLDGTFSENARTGSEKGSFTTSLGKTFPIELTRYVDGTKLSIKDVDGIPLLQVMFSTDKNQWTGEVEYIVSETAGSFGLNGFLTESQLYNLNKNEILSSSFCQVVIQPFVSPIAINCRPLQEQDPLKLSANKMIKQACACYGAQLVELAKNGNYSGAQQKLDDIFNAYNVDGFIHDIKGKELPSELERLLLGLKEYLSARGMADLVKIVDEKNAVLNHNREIREQNRRLSYHSHSDTVAQLREVVKKGETVISDDGSIHLPLPCSSVFLPRELTSDKVKDHLIGVVDRLGEHLKWCVENSNPVGEDGLSTKAIAHLTAVLKGMEKIRSEEDFEKMPIKYAIKLGLNPFALAQSWVALSIEDQFTIPQDPREYGKVSEKLRSKLPENPDYAKAMLCDIWQKGMAAKKQDTRDKDYYFFLSGIANDVAPKLKRISNEINNKLSELENSPELFTDLKRVGEKSALIKKKYSLAKTEELLTFLNETCACLVDPVKEKEEETNQGPSSWKFW